MANWQRKINLYDLMDSYDPGEGNDSYRSARITAKRLKHLRPFKERETPDYEYINEELQEIIDEFEDLGKTDELDQDEAVGLAEFNNILSRLFDWGDICLDNEWPGKKSLLGKCSI